MSHLFCAPDLVVHFLSFQVNELDGIPLILDSSNIDDNNPCILDCGPRAGASAWLAPVLALVQYVRWLTHSTVS